VDGTVIDAIVLDPGMFGIVPNTAVLHQVITAQLAAARSGTQSTRTRAEVRGGGAKPFRQKGTGRARQGSIRSPQWTGGGVALGPKPRSYRQRTPKKMIRLALYSALSDRAGEGRVALVDEWTFPAPKTKDAVAALSALGLAGKVLVVLGPDDGIPDRSFANLPEVRTIQAGELNAYDIMRSDWVVFTDRTVPGETSPGSLSDVASVPGPASPAPAGSGDKAATPARATARTRTRPVAAQQASAAAESSATDTADEDATPETAETPGDSGKSPGDSGSGEEDAP
jgi:large subunit ribosomal protein L4